MESYIPTTSRFRQQLSVSCRDVRNEILHHKGQRFNKLWNYVEMSGCLSKFLFNIATFCHEKQADSLK